MRRDAAAALPSFTGQARAVFLLALGAVQWPGRRRAGPAGDAENHCIGKHVVAGRLEVDTSSVLQWAAEVRVVGWARGGVTVAHDGRVGIALGDVGSAHNSGGGLVVPSNVRVMPLGALCDIVRHRRGCDPENPFGTRNQPASNVS